MFRNFFKTAFRNIRANKLFSAINVIGLAIGICSSLVIFLIVQYDFSFDKFEDGRSRIFRIVWNDLSPDAPFPLAAAVKNEVTGLETVASFSVWDDDVTVGIPRRESEKPTEFKQEGDIIFAGADYFSLIRYKWLAGSPSSSLSAPYQTVLSRKNINRFFPGLSPGQVIGKQVIFNDSIYTTVSGVVDNLENNTDFNFQTFVSLSSARSILPEYFNSWKVSTSQLFIRLTKSADPKNIRDQVATVYDLHTGKSPKGAGGSSIQLQPLSALHFSNFHDDFGLPKAHLPTLLGLMGLGIILLLLAVINFINLTTAQSSERAKEIGIRKTLGGSRRQLIFQFLSETFILTSIATLISIIFAPLLLNAFSDFISDRISFDILQSGVILFLVITTVLVSLIAGIYPALILSSYKPIAVLKNQTVNWPGNTRGLFFRKTLTVSQFVIAQIFIIATIIIGMQIHFELTKDMGFKKEAIIYFGTDYKDTSTAKRKVLLHQLKSIPEIANVSLAGFPPSTDGGLGFNIKYRNGEEMIDTSVRIKPADSNYINLYHIKLLAGTNLRYSDTVNSILINEKCSQILGFKNPQEAVGKYVETNFYREKIPIAGVVANFIQGSLYDKIMPLVIFSDASMQLTFNVALKPENKDGLTWRNGIDKINAAFKKIYPDTNLEVHFLDDAIAKYYESDRKTSILLRWATGIAIVISCLGLLGLVVYTTNQRTKEIGIRKIVGASISDIITLLSKDFLKLVFIAFVIAVPIIWIAAIKWLENFAFRIELNAWYFVAGGCILFVPAFIILFLRTYRSATANPADCLRSE